MYKVKVNLLGMGAVKISDGGKSIYVDAFSKWVKPFLVGKADLILVTHDDEDHFGSRETGHASTESGAIVVGPPSIAYPLLVNEQLSPEKLQIIYPLHLKKPITKQIHGIDLKVYQTRHFLDWEPVHISYLIRLCEKRLYITGDSSMMDEDDPDLKQLDALIYNLVPRDVSDASVMNDHISALEEIQKKFHPRFLLPNHLLHCNWTVEPRDLKKEVEKRGLERIVVIEDEREGFEIP